MCTNLTFLDDNILMQYTQVYKDIISTAYTVHKIILILIWWLNKNIIITK